MLRGWSTAAMSPPPRPPPPTRPPCPRSIIGRPSTVTRSATTTSRRSETEPALGRTVLSAGTYDQRYQALFEGGLKIYTNLDPALQNAWPNRPSPATPPPTVRASSRPWSSIDPATGKVVAMVGWPGGAELPIRHHHPGHPPRARASSCSPCSPPSKTGLLDLRHAGCAVTVRHRFSHRPRSGPAIRLYNDEGNGGGGRHPSQRHRPVV